MQANLPAAVEVELVAFLQQCRLQKSLQHARSVHAYMCEHRLEVHPVLGNYLVSALVACGSVPDAQHLLDRLPHANEHSWTSLITGYINSNDLQRGYELYHQMQEQDTVQPNRCTYLALLQSCARLKDPQKGRILHADVTLRGLEREIFNGGAIVGNTLVDMYGKCSLLAEAHSVFDGLLARDIVSWNALIAGHAECGHNKDVGDYFWQMQLDCISPDSVTFVSSLKACTTAGVLKTGQTLHAEITKRGLEKNLCVGNTLIDMYTNCHLLIDAQEVFDQQPVRDAVSWNTLIAGYADHGFGQKAGKCLQQMQADGISPCSVTLLCSLKACSTSGALQIGQKIHAEAVKRGLERQLHLGSALVDMYTKCSSLVDAHRVFIRLPEQDVVLWAALIAKYADHGPDKEILDCFRQMQLENVLVDAVMFVTFLKACSALKNLQTGQTVHDETVKRGFEVDLYVGSMLVDMYAKCGMLAEAQGVFDRLVARDAVSWAALISGYADYGLDEELLSCFRQMQLEGLTADAATFVLCLRACGTTGSLQTGRDIHMEIRKSGFESDIFVGSMLVDMYGKCGSVTEGWQVFNKLPSRDVVTWNTMINAFGENHEFNLAVRTFEDMEEQDVKPDSITFTCLLAACSHASLVFEGKKYFKTMKEKYGVEPTVDHYACMVDLFARSGLVDEIEKVLEAMQCPPSRVVLVALLSACKIYGRLGMGERCFRQLVEVNEDDASAYLLMADIYAGAGRWRDANRLQEMRKSTGAKKKSGSAFIESNGRLHDFIAGVNHSEDTDRAFDVLCVHIKNEGYVPTLEFVPITECNTVGVC